MTIEERAKQHDPNYPAKQASFIDGARWAAEEAAKVCEEYVEDQTRYARQDKIAAAIRAILEAKEAERA